ncbi:MAG: hypothetical protein LBK72_01085 [Bifidobacteriaceae bacterium]|jgi:hypothetical protein|nr:hypothetical protein [Bifidobacteriaceae bacterium]
MTSNRALFGAALSAVALVTAMVAGSAPAVAAPASPYAVDVTAPKTASLNAKIKIAATVTATGGGTAAPGLKVELQRKIAGTSWHAVKTAKTSKAGVATFTVVFALKTLFRVKVLATKDTRAVTSAPVTTQVKGSTDIRAIVAAKAKACHAQIATIDYQVKDPTALAYLVSEPIKFDSEYALANAGCGSTNKKDGMRIGGGAMTLFRKTGSAWNEIFAFHQAACDDLDGKGYPKSLIPTCVTKDGTQRAPR